MLESPATGSGRDRTVPGAPYLRRSRMKKGKRSAGWQDEEQNPAQKIEFDLTEEDSEGIIDLDDILEVDDEALLEEDQFDLDVEILDAEADLDVDELDAGLGDEDEELLDDEFLKDFSVAREEPTSDLEKGMPSLDEQEPEEDEIDFESLLKIEMDQEDVDDVADAGPVADEVPRGVAAASVLSEEADSSPVSLESFVSQIEERLIDAVRQVVEEKLPEIVRSLLEEHIEKLKRELH
jgi:hypothetical protein